MGHFGVSFLITLLAQSLQSIVVLATALSAVTAAEQSQACLDAISTLQTDENLQTAFAALNTEYAAFEATDFCLISETKASCLLNYQDLDSYEPFVAACGDAGGLFFTTDYDVICSDATRDDITIQFYNAPGCAGAECNLEGQDDVNLDNFLSQLLGGREGLTCSARGDSDDNGGSAAARVSILSLLGALITMEWIFLLS